MQPSVDKPDSVIAAMLNSCGVLLILSGLIHIAVWFVLGGEWEGAVSWRKPILFGISTGATVLSVGWIVGKLKPQNWDRFIFGLFGFALVAEVALITVQQWRGVASHFNQSTAVDATIENWMTYLIVFATVVLVDVTRRCFDKIDAPTDQVVAIRGGMTFLVVSCLIGFVILFYGQSRVAVGEDPSVYGEAGVTKFPHGVAIHSIQFFPLACWLLMKLGVPIKNRTRAASCLVASMTFFLAYSIVQTLAGKARFDFTIAGILLLAISLLLLTPVLQSLARLIWTGRLGAKEHKSLLIDINIQDQGKRLVKNEDQC